jgi:two-component system response regulator AtoC
MDTAIGRELMSDHRHSVLVVDDEPAVRNALKCVLEDDYRVLTAPDGPHALETLRTDSQIDVVLLDMIMPGMHGLEVLRRMRSEFAAVEVIVLSALQSIETVIEAINLGAFDYVGKPFVTSELALIVARAIELRTLKRQVRRLREEVGGSEPVELVGASAAVMALRRRAQELGRHHTPFLVVGERGVGKELFAHAVHWRRHGSDEPFTPVRCPDLAKQHDFRNLVVHDTGLTGATRDRAAPADRQPRRDEHVGHSTEDAGLDDERTNLNDRQPVEPETLGLPCQGLVLFKDADRLRPSEQRALSRLVQVFIDRGVCVAATILPPAPGAALDEQLDSGLCRLLGGAIVTIGPLRERYEDIKPLAQHFVRELRVEVNAAAERISAEAIGELETYAWPGNVRELRNFVERILILHADAPVIERSHLPDEIGATAARALSATDFIGKKTLKEAVNELERRIITDALRRAGGVQTRASELLGTTRRILRYRMQQLGIE